MNKNVLIPIDVSDSGKDYLLSRGYTLKILNDSSVENICHEIGDCAAVLGRFGSYPAEIFEAAPELKIFAKHGTGTDDIDLATAAEHGVIVTNTPEANAGCVAEHTIGMMLACVQDIVQMDRKIRDGEFTAARKKLTGEVNGMILGLVGFGRIARETAKKAALGLGMNVLFWNRSKVTDVPEYAVQVEDLDTLLVQSDVISLHVPYAPGTHHLVDRKALSAMKSTAVLLNLSRGGLVDEEALYEALRGNQIASAGLDCFELEPTASDNPLLSLDNIIVTPHGAGLGTKSASRMSLHAAMCIDDVLQGREPKWRVRS